MNEPDIIRQVQKGDVNAFEELVTRHEKLVYSIAYRLLGNEEDAQDASQEAFTKAFISIGSFRGESKFSVWLYRLTNNVCVDMLRKRNSGQMSLSMEDGEGEESQFDIADERFEPDRALEKKELRCEIDKALAALPDNYRQVLVLREVGGQSYEEIADSLGLDIGTVKSRIFRARKKLCVFLSSDGNFSGEKASKKQKGGAQA